MLRNKVVLITCVKGKYDGPCAAEELYKGARFKNSLCVARNLNPDFIFILSALHHILKLDDIIENYDLTLKDFSPIEKIIWAEEVINQLADLIDIENDIITIIGGRDYTQPLLNHFEFENLMEGKGNYGQQNTYLKELCNQLRE
tara:strand:+ start:1008 stop:1439 length:432 start_codon:yes stop_codon:yes gene_type:complete